MEIMGVEVVKPDLIPISMDTGSEENSGSLHGKENGKANHGPALSEPINFGSNVTDEPVKQEGNNVSEVNFPKDAVDEWPAPKQIHSFYIIKYRSYDDQKLKAKLDHADKELQRKNQTRSQITENLRAKRADRAQVISQLKSSSVENKQFRMIMDEKRKEIEPLQQALGKLRGGNGIAREKGVIICSSEEELNNLIKSLQYRIQHESIPLTEEKQLLREIKQLEGTREKVIAHAAVRAKIQDSLGEKEVIQDQVKLIGVDLDGVRKEQQTVRVRLKQLEDEKEAIDKDINLLQEELTAITEKRDKAFENIQELRKQREDGNAGFYQNRMLLTKARELAARKDVEALTELADVEVEKFMANWSSKKAFRDDYERRILSSLDIRQLSRDGRMRNPDEKPLVEAPTFSETDVLPKINAKQPKEDSASPLQNDILSTQKIHKESSEQQKEGNKSTEGTLERNNLEDEEEFYGLERQQKKVNEIDEAKLKELKREELAKAKQALERKKKLVQKSAAKAALKAQKEAEKKLKEREKKAKKKATTAVFDPDALEPTEEVLEAAEPEKAEEHVEETKVTSKNKEPKGKERKETIRYRRRAKGPDTLPKPLLKRKRPMNYWIWAAPAAAILVLILAFAFIYFQPFSTKV